MRAYQIVLVFIMVGLGELIIPANTFAQFSSKVWCFGDSAGINFTNSSSPTLFTSTRISRGSCNSIADSAGNLLFYTGTFYLPLWAAGYLDLTAIYNSQDTVMEGGDSILGRSWYRELAIIPYPGHSNLFYTFSIGVTSQFGLAYSVVDLNQNNGLGKVISKNNYLNNLDATDCLTAIKHGNGRDWWIISRVSDTANNDFYVYLVTPDTISLMNIQTIGTLSTVNLFRIEPSDDGSILSCIDSRGLIENIGFDRCSGLLYNPVIFQNETASATIPWYFSNQLSPNKSKLYIQQITQGPLYQDAYLIQIDLNTMVKDTLHHFVYPEGPGMMELAPDGKIYLSVTQENPNAFPFPYPDSVHTIVNENLSVINFPDSAGVACDFQPYSFYLGGNRTYYGLPNNPHYELGPLIGSICDSLSVGLSKPTPVWDYKLFPNPCYNKTNLEVNTSRNITGSYQVFTATGIEITKQIKLESFNSIDLSNQATGVYFVRISQIDKVKTMKLVKW